MGVFAAQFNATVPARVSRAASSVSQSDTSPGLASGLGTAPPVAHTLVCCADTTLGEIDPAKVKIKVAIPRAVSLQILML